MLKVTTYSPKIPYLLLYCDFHSSEILADSGATFDEWLMLFLVGRRACDKRQAALLAKFKTDHAFRQILS